MSLLQSQDFNSLAPVWSPVTKDVLKWQCPVPAAPYQVWDLVRGPKQLFPRCQALCPLQGWQEAATAPCRDCSGWLGGRQRALLRARGGCSTATRQLGAKAAGPQPPELPAQGASARGTPRGSRHAAGWCCRRTGRQAGDNMWGALAGLQHRSVCACAFARREMLRKLK